jgi:disulfide oxidoreductase YuzD
LVSDIRIQILVGDDQGECDANCGMDWSAAESISLAAGRIKERFGEDVPIERIDMREDRNSEFVRGWSETIKTRNLSLPLLLLNGQVRISGQFDMRQLLDVIEIERELGGY